jgi:hypothetical protein
MQNKYQSQRTEPTWARRAISIQNKFFFRVLAVLIVGVACAQAQTNWTQLSPSGGPPQARFQHTAVLNTSNGRMIIFGGVIGGNGPSGEQNDVWIFQDARTNTGNAWQQLTVGGTLPRPRCSQSSVYDQLNNRTIVFGGNPDTGFCYQDLNDVWVLTNADGTGGTAGWTQLSPTGTPPSVRSSASAIYDQANNRMILYGGNEQCESADSDLWVLTNANGLGGTPGWIQLSPAGGPGPRTLHSATYDPVNNRMILFGGQGGNPYALVTNDTWVLSNANGLGGTPAWTLLNVSGPLPSPRYLVASAYDSALNTLVVFGGNPGSGGYTNDTWVLSNANGLGGTPAWTQSNLTGPLPSGRQGASCVRVPGTDRIVIFGGENNTGALYNDVWALECVPIPALNIASVGNQSVLYWSASATNYVLQTTTNLSPPNWVTVSNGTPIIGVTLTNSSPAAFFRLIHQ